MRALAILALLTVALPAVAQTAPTSDAQVIVQGITDWLTQNDHFSAMANVVVVLGAALTFSLGYLAGVLSA